MVTLVMGKGWHKGISSEVFLAPIIPATRATPSASPFLRLPSMSRSIAAWVSWTVAVARAMREVSALSETSTIRA